MDKKSSGDFVTTITRVLTIIGIIAIIGLIIFCLPACNSDAITPVHTKNPDINSDIPQENTTITNVLVRTTGDGTIIGEYENVTDSHGEPSYFGTIINLKDSVGNEHTYYGDIIVEIHKETVTPSQKSTMTNTFKMYEMGPPPTSQAKG